MLVPRLLDRFPHDPQRVIRPNPGLWFNTATVGRGFDIEVFGRLLSVIWYTYDEAGLPVWYIAAGPLTGFDFTADLLRFSQAPDGSTSFVVAGELSLRFQSERRAAMSWTLGGLGGAEDLDWLAFDADPASSDFTGLWGRPDAPGWGLSLATQGAGTVAIAFIFDEAGDPRWVLSDAVPGQGTLEFEINAYFSDTLCPGCEGPPSFRFEPAGTMRLRPDTAGDWSSEIDLPAPLSGTWDLHEASLTRFSEEPVGPR